MDILPAKNNTCPGCLRSPLSRRDMLRASAQGFGWLSLCGMLAQEGGAQDARLPQPHFRPRAKNVIFCFMDGGVSHVDSFDPKPELERRDNQPFLDSRNPTAMGSNRRWLKSPWAFRRRGQSGLPISNLFPHIASCADELAVIRSMKADLPLHSTGVLFLHTGLNNAGRPSLGSWVTYGLGSENRNLPGFVVLSFGVVPCGGLENFSNGFLPANHQATVFHAEGTPIDNIRPPVSSNRPLTGHGSPVQPAMLDLLRNQDADFARSTGGERAISSAIRNYELAYRMQALVPDVLDLASESQATQRLYGIDSNIATKRLYGIQCLRARRLIESGVRFVEITCPPGASNGAWDQHGNLKAGHEKNALDTDQAIAGLINDLKRRGLLDETLILWAGEFGRTPHSASRDGRDHHPEGFSVWLAGGGVKGGTIYGATDDFGMHASEGICTMHDLHATILHLLGIDHERLTYRFGGREFRLTDVHGHVVEEIIA
jgi:predicted metallopeptidase